MWLEIMSDEIYDFAQWNEKDHIQRGVGEFKLSLPIHWIKIVTIITIGEC